jgi:hypothetical protein
LQIHTNEVYAVKVLCKDGLDARQLRFQQREIKLHHGIDFVGVNVHGGVNNAVGSDTQDSGEFQPVG